MRTAILFVAFLLTWSVSAQHAAPTFPVNVKDLGAKGDGKNNDAAAFASALAAGGSVYVPPGTYLLGPKPLSLPKNLVLRGDGRATVLKPVPGTASTTGATTWSIRRD